VNYQNILHEFFPTLPAIKLIWGKHGKYGKQKSIRLASFWPRKKEIIIHPFLNENPIPLFYIEYLIFHELCHAYLIFTGKAINAKQHGPEFSELENQFPQIEKAMQWEKNDLPSILKDSLK
jgi:predicted metal-dependent hydrolase